MALNSKRMQTFFNEFIITTTNFLNQFATEVEDKFFDFDRKLNKIESNLMIIEAKLESIPTEQPREPTTLMTQTPAHQNLPEIETLSPTGTMSSNKTGEIKIESTAEVKEKEEENLETSSNHQDESLIKVCDSALYKKFFKMIKFGIPPPAVKQKMTSEGLDCSILDNPDFLIEKTAEDYEE